MKPPHGVPESFLKPWTELLASHRAEQANGFPNHHLDNLGALMTTSSLKSLHLGTGYSIFSRALLPAILAAQTSVHFVTCYWAASPTLDAICQVLLELASVRRARADQLPPLRISVGFSSWGLFQKIFHTSSRRGKVCQPSQWATLGLPDDATLRSGGIELTVKSLFFTPFSVMHPKYIIIDARKVFLPSCNVSWERWFEGCVELEGDAVSTLLAFHQRVWGTATEHESDAVGGAPNAVADSATGTDNDQTSPEQSVRLELSEPVPTIVLPSSHHRNPGFSFFPLLSHSNPPMTPLNAALLTLFANARRKITILTPNLTSGPVLEALIKALNRGVDVNIRTSKNMMLIEQLVTAGTTTSRCISKLVNEYHKLLSRSHASDPEAQTVSPGRLQILYFKQLTSKESGHDEPVVSHFKMTYVDDEYLVLGSGNMDRASWWTSQELGVLFYVPGFQGQALWDKVLERRTEVVFQSRDH